jgi:hypothetical protein
MTHQLFSYGTLQLEKVQLETFGRMPTGSKDILSGYRLDMLKITDAGVIEKSSSDLHPILTPTGNAADKVEGTVFEITQAELIQADAYEVADYQRISIVLDSGTTAWVYIGR